MWRDALHYHAENTCQTPMKVHVKLGKLNTYCICLVRGFFNIKQFEKSEKLKLNFFKKIVDI